MAFFSFGKKNQQQAFPCSCGGNCPAPQPESARFLVLGACCKTSADTFANVSKAVAELGLSDTVVNVGDPVQIAQYGVMQTPALVMDGKVLAYGKLISVEQAKTLISNAGAGV